MEQARAVPQYPRSIREQLQRAKAPKNAPGNDGLRRMVDIEAKKAEGKGAGYVNWATTHNLKNAARALALYQEYGFKSRDELDAAITAARADMDDTRAGLKRTESLLQEKKEEQRNLLNFIKTKPVMDGLKAQKSEKARRAYREQHESDLIIYEAARNYFKGKGVTKLPGRKALRDEIEQLTVRQNAEYNAYREKKGRVRELETIRDNIEQTLHGAPSQQKKHEQER